jgi:hypothetical protein
VEQHPRLQRRSFVGLHDATHSSSSSRRLPAW